MISNLSLATNPEGIKLCAVWTELLDKNTKLYYKFLDIESPDQAEAVEINETNPISYLNIFYNGTNDEFVIIYTAENILKLVTVDSMGFSNPPMGLAFSIPSGIIKIIWNESDNLYAAVAHKQNNTFNLIQFDINGNLISDNSFVIDNISIPNNICIYYDKINYAYNIFVSEKDALYQITIDSQSNILNTAQNKLPANFNGEFDIADNGESYYLFYTSGLVKKIIHTKITYEGEYSTRFTKLMDIERYNEGINPSAVFSNEKLGLLYTIDKENAISSLGIAMPYKSGNWESSKRNNITAFGGRYGVPASGEGDIGKRKTVSYGGRPVNIPGQTWEIPPETTSPAQITAISGNEGTRGRSTRDTHRDLFREINTSTSNTLTDLAGQPNQIILADRNKALKDAMKELRIVEQYILRTLNYKKRFEDNLDELEKTKDSLKAELAMLIKQKERTLLRKKTKKKTHQDALLAVTRAKGQTEKNRARIKANQAQSLLQELNRTLQEIDRKIHEQEKKIVNINTSITMAEKMLNQENNNLAAAIKRRDEVKKIIGITTEPVKETKTQRRKPRHRSGTRR